MEVYVMNNQWAKLASDMQGNGEGGSIGFVKEDKTVLKIVAPEGAKENFDTSWFMEFRQYFQDKPSKKFMIYAIDVQADDKKVMPWVINASSFTQMLALIGDDDFDILSPSNGHPVSIKKSGQGMNTKYQVNVAAKAFDSTSYNTDTCMSLEQAIEQLTKDKGSKSANNDENEIEW
jgi:hypothetical protein